MRRSPERSIHLAVLGYLRAVLPGALVHHAAQGLDIPGPAAARAVAKAKHMGMLPGWPDLEVLHRGRFLAFEVKAEGGRLSPAQSDVRAAMEAQGVPYAVVRSIDDVREALVDWGIHTTEAA